MEVDHFNGIQFAMLGCSEILEPTSFKVIHGLSKRARFGLSGCGLLISWPWLYCCRTRRSREKTLEMNINALPLGHYVVQDYSEVELIRYEFGV